VPVCTKSVRRSPVSVCGLHVVDPIMECMDIVAVALALITFAVLYALIVGIERI
jgi:hypothetical protein